jgi:hypothetical protein
LYKKVCKICGKNHWHSYNNEDSNQCIRCDVIECLTKKIGYELIFLLHHKTKGIIFPRFYYPIWKAYEDGGDAKNGGDKNEELLEQVTSNEYIGGR